MDYSKARSAIDEIINAIKDGKYEVSFDEANNIRECTAPDGRTFYKVVDMDGVKSSNDFGTCYVDVNGYSFSCDLGTGEYESDFFDDIEEEYTLEDGTTVDKDDLIEEIIDAFNDTDDIYFGEYTEMDAQMEVFAKINKIEDPEYYWCEDSDCPIDVDDDWNDFTKPEDLGYGSVTYNGQEYYLVDEPTGEDGEELHAVSSKATSSDSGYYDTVLLTVNHGDNDEIIVTSCEESEDEYNAVDGYVE